MRRFFWLSIATILAATMVMACAPPEERADRYFEKAQALYQQGDLEKSRLEARNALQVQPRNAEARYLLAKIAEKNEQWREMYQHLLVAVDTDAEHLKARAALAQLLFRGQAFDQMAGHLEVLLELAPADPEVAILDARLRVHNRDLPGAARSLERALEVEPDNIEALILQAVLLADESPEEAFSFLDTQIARLPAGTVGALRQIRTFLLAQNDRIPEAVEELTLLVADNPDVVPYRDQLAGLLAAEGRVDELDALLYGQVTRNPGDLAARLNYVNFLLSERGAGAAEDMLKLFLEDAPESDRLRLGLAELYEGTGRPEEARELYLAAARADSSSPEGLDARVRLANSHLVARETDEARAAVESVLGDAPNHPAALVLRARLNFLAGQWQEVIGDLRVVLRQDEENEQATLLLANAFRLSGERVLAKDAYSRLLQVSPGHPRASAELAGILVQEGDLAGARSVLQRRTQAAPSDVLASGRLAEVLRAMGDLDAAEAEALRIAAIDSPLPMAEWQMGRLLVDRGDSLAAIPYFEAVVSRAPEDAGALEALVNARAAAGRNAENLAALGAVLEKNPDNPPASVLLAQSHVREGNVAAAIETLESMLRRQPDLVQGWVLLASIQGDDLEARRLVLERGLQQLPADPQLSLALGSTLADLRRHDEAIALYEKAMTVHAESEALAFNLATTLVNFRSDPESHQKALQVAQLFSRSDSPPMLDTLGWAHYLNDNYEAAVGPLERAVAGRGDVPLFRYHLGMTYRAMGNVTGARRELELALSGSESVFPGIDKAREALSALP